MRSKVSIFVGNFEVLVEKIRLPASGCISAILAISGVANSAPDVSIGVADIRFMYN